ncbi:hypothetical protein INS90_09695 [Trueperella pecoris]|uniref:Uncharacterized protein n=1 Tax=Trueperella pecoris TaxID=2733571 RepID=A0A7M1R209_9ACTO|nr:hypothetical protein [Trueperella pecoris]QOR47505.1 hypothetical protein INS90_09695 [Trueperella pecoris]
MANFDELIEIINTVYVPRMSSGATFAIKNDLEQQDYDFAVDSFLQFTLLEDIDVPVEILADIESEVHAAWDPELTERTLGWIAKHRARSST